MMITKKCKDCGQAFSWPNHQKPRCPDCTKERRRKALARYGRSAKRKECTKRYLLSHPDRRFCSTYPQACPKCGQPMHKTAQMCKSCFIKVMKNRPPEEHGQWRGGRVIGRDGYIFVRQPTHPRAVKRGGYVAEHILVWEQTHGRPLPPGWVVHHLNGIKNDNRPKNLVGLPSQKHNLVFEAKAKRIQELEALLNNQHQLL